jgi:tetratricopeptide (TPR) repeat protein
VVHFLRGLFSVTPRASVFLLFLAAPFAWAVPDRSEPASLGKADWIAHAKDLERRKDWQGLLDWGGHWTRAEPASATAWFVLGRAYGKLRRYPEAIAAYRQDLAIEPGDIYALNNLANLYRDGRQFRDAITAYWQAVQVDPDYLPAWENLGLAFLAWKGIAGVTHALQQLSVSDPELAEAWRKLILDYALSRDPRVAQKAVDVLRGLDADKRRRMFEILFAST